ncbi:MAG: LacI family DNA-binding transcriptional regulator [Ethanoligenens sp.]
MISIKDIAEKCNLSISTVSKALNSYSDVSDSTKQKVLKVAAECGYFPNSMARALKTNCTHNLGVLFSDDMQSGLRHDHFAAILDAFKVEAEKRSYDISFISNNMVLRGRPLTYLEHCRYRNFDGVCVACIDFQKPEVLELIGSDIPVVTIDHIFNNRTSINSAHVKGMQELVTYIYNRGHRKIAYIHGKKSAVTEQRLTSFCKTLKNLGVDVPSKYLVEAAYRDPATTQKGVETLLNLSDPPTCILMPDDYAALGGMTAIEAAGLKIPGDISIAGYDGIALSQMVTPKLTTLLQDENKIGSEAAHRLIEQIEDPLTTIIENVLVPGKLIEGGTVASISP